jgi:hypothetical protein
MAIGCRHQYASTINKSLCGAYPARYTRTNATRILDLITLAMKLATDESFDFHSGYRVNSGH